MPKIGLISGSLPNHGTQPVKPVSSSPSARRAPRNQALSTARASQAGTGSPARSSYRGERQATASTVNEMVSAATAPAMASSGETGRSCAPPMPWARGTSWREIMPSDLSASVPLLRAGRRPGRRLCQNLAWGEARREQGGSMTERLRPSDLALLAGETPATPMHNATVEIFDPGESGFDYARLVELIADRIAFVPRYRQRLQSVPGRLANPVWVDDPDFDLGLPRTPLGAAAARAAWTSSASWWPGSSPGRWTAAGRCGRSTSWRASTERPGRAAVEVPPDPRRRRRDRRPRPGAARRRTRAASRSWRDDWAPRSPADPDVAGRRRPAGVRAAARRGAARPCAATSDRRLRGRPVRRSSAAGSALSALSNRRPVSDSPVTGRLSQQRRFVTVRTDLADYRTIRQTPRRHRQRRHPGHRHRRAAELADDPHRVDGRAAPAQGRGPDVA